MNERIKLIAEKADISFDKYGLAFDNADHPNGIDLLLFVELYNKALIEEIKKTSENMVYAMNEAYIDTIHSDTYEIATKDALSVIEHFGE